MRQKTFSTSSVRARLLPLFLASLFLCSCSLTREARQEGKRRDVISSIAVTGFSFLEGLSETSESKGSAGSAVGGGDASDPQLRDMLSDMLFERMVALGGYVLYSPYQASAARAALLSTDRALRMNQHNLSIEIGKRLEAEALLTGTLLRWRERQGKEYAVESPASVAFDLQLISVKDGELIWRGRFDKTQRSLSEDLFDLGTFIRARGRWMTARELALSGMDGLLSEMVREIKPLSEQRTPEEERL